MKRIKEMMIDIWKEFKKIPNSVKFWNCLLLILLVGVGVHSTFLLNVLLVMGSILAIAVSIDGDDLSNHLWVLFMPITWGVILLGLAIWGTVYLYSISIARFNRWLDGENDAIEEPEDKIDTFDAYN